jgi:hypothetical protein
MTTPTTADIQTRHFNIGLVPLLEFTTKDTNDAHKDRGILLARLAAVEAASNAIQCPEHDVCPRSCFYRIIKEALK